MKSGCSGPAERRKTLRDIAPNQVLTVVEP